ncbi:MAG: MerR family transcriptional regulator [Saprospiraceae bacterium]|nr:MerR family transcriptional regulator [Saprospiraceae bacterium]
MENLSGVKAHTIRIWEKRYEIIKPKRTKTNIRYYTDEDLRHLLNVCLLYRNGLKISKIAKLSQDEIKERISAFTKIDLDFEDQLDALMLFILDLDSYNFSKVLDQHIDQIGLERTMDEVIYPLMDKIAFAWLAGSFQGVHESFVTQIIKAKIQNQIEGLEEETYYKPKYLIYLTKGEKQELSLLYMHFLLKKNKCKVVNLGYDIALVDVISAINVTKPKNVFTIFNEEINSNSFQNYVNQVCKNLEDANFILTGYQATSQNIKWPKNAIVLSNLKDTIEYIQTNK